MRKNLGCIELRWYRCKRNISLNVLGVKYAEFVVPPTSRNEFMNQRKKLGECFGDKERIVSRFPGGQQKVQGPFSGVIYKAKS